MTEAIANRLPEMADHELLEVVQAASTELLRRGGAQDAELPVGAVEGEQAAGDVPPPVPEWFGDLQRRVIAFLNAWDLTQGKAARMFRQPDALWEGCSPISTSSLGFVVRGQYWLRRGKKWERSIHPERGRRLSAVLAYWEEVTA